MWILKIIVLQVKIVISYYKKNTGLLYDTDKVGTYFYNVNWDLPAEYIFSSYKKEDFLLFDLSEDRNLRSTPVIHPMFDTHWLIHRSYSNADRDKLKILKTKQNYSNVVGLKYQGVNYYPLSEKFLTATSKDVRAGQTFIGLSNIIEEGRMEV